MWGNLACDISDRLAGAKTLQMRFEIIERALLANANRQLNRHPAVEFALNRFELPARSGSIAQVTEKVGLSSRWFIEQFKSEVGLTPKLYSRVRRFQRSLRLIETARAIDWAEIALDCGYYDQAHFIHDFQAFANTNPSDYLRSKGEHLNHLPLP